MSSDERDQDARDEAVALLREMREQAAQRRRRNEVLIWGAIVVGVALFLLYVLR